MSYPYTHTRGYEPKRDDEPTIAELTERLVERIAREACKSVRNEPRP